MLQDKYHLRSQFVKDAHNLRVRMKRAHVVIDSPQHNEVVIRGAFVHCADRKDSVEVVALEDLLDGAPNSARPYLCPSA